jgi:tetratricopeptide (TPR) repeat protein
MHRNFLFCSVLVLLACGCHIAPWQTADSEDGEPSSPWPTPRYASAAERLPEPEPEPESHKTPELSLATARWMEGVGNLLEARRHYQDVIEEDPKQVDALLGLARIEQLSGRAPQAEQQFLSALRLEPDSPVVLHALGLFYQSQQRWPEAVDVLNKAMLAAPTETQYRHDLAVALVHNGNLNAARTHFVRTVGDAAAHYNIGLILHEMGEVDAAEQQMLLAVTKQPELQNAQYWLDEIRREREAAWVVQESLAESSGTAESGLRPAGYQAPQTAAAATRSGHSLTSNPAAPVQALTPQQQQMLNQR